MATSTIITLIAILVLILINLFTLDRTKQEWKKISRLEKEVGYWNYSGKTTGVSRSKSMAMTLDELNHKVKKLNADRRHTHNSLQNLQTRKDRLDDSINDNRMLINELANELGKTIEVIPPKKDYSYKLKDIEEEDGEEDTDDNS